MSLHTGRSGGSTARHSYASRTKGYLANKRGPSPTRGGLSARQVGTEAKTDRSSRPRQARATPPVVPALDAAALVKAAPSHTRHAALSRWLDGLTCRNQFSHRSHASPHVRDLVPAPKCHFSFKCCVVGDSGVGKSSLVFGSAAANADLDLRSTANRKQLAGAGGAKAGDSQVPKLGLGVNVRVRLYEVGSEVIKAELWDCPGLLCFASVVPHYCAGAAGFMFVYDVTNAHSFKHVHSWVRRALGGASMCLSEVKAATDGNRSSSHALPATGLQPRQARCIMLVANKVKCSPSDREVSQSQGELLAAQYGMTYLETDAEHGHNVSEAFTRLATSVVRTIPRPPEPSLLLKSGISVGDLLKTSRAFVSALYSTSEPSRVDPLSRAVERTHHNGAHHGGRRSAADGHTSAPPPRHGAGDRGRGAPANGRALRRASSHSDASVGSHYSAAMVVGASDLGPRRTSVASAAGSDASGW